MYCYIKNGLLDCTSDELITKRQEEVTKQVTNSRNVEKIVHNDETGEDETIIVAEDFIDTIVVEHFVDGLVYDEVIKTKLTGRVKYENGKIVSDEENPEIQ